MQRDKIFLAKKTLKLLETKSLEAIKLSEILNKGNNKSIKNKNDLLININKYFDFLLKKNLSTLEKSSKRDMIFEVYMARYDILNLHRISIKNIIKYLLSKPHKLIKLAPSFIESIILMATLSDIDVYGIKGIPKIKFLFLLYFLLIYTWSKDESSSLEKTMTTLDKYLSNIEKFIDFF